MTAALRIRELLLSVGLDAPTIGEPNDTAYAKILAAFEVLIPIAKAANLPPIRECWNEDLCWRPEDYSSLASARDALVAALASLPARTHGPIYPLPEDV